MAGVGKTEGPIMTVMEDVPGTPSNLGPSGGATTGGVDGMEKQSESRIRQVTFVSGGGLDKGTAAKG